MNGTNDPSIVDAVVVGAGPCGTAAAVQLIRYGFRVILFEELRVGGLLRNASLVENYPGFPDGISGPDLCRLLERQIRNAGVDLVSERINRVTKEPDRFVLESAAGSTVLCRALLLAAGTEPKRGLLNEKPDCAKGRILYEPADLPVSIRGFSFLIAGGGDAAYDYALHTANRGGRVLILSRGEPRALPLLVERARAHPSIEERMGAEIVGIDESNKGATVRFRHRNETAERRADYLLIAYGRDSRDHLLRQLVPSGRIAECSTPGLYTGGDMVRGSFRQAGIAVGDGLLAAMQAARYLATRSETE